MRYLSLAAVVAMSLSVPELMSGAGLSIANYQFISESPVTIKKSNVTYRADLVNPGNALVSVTATLSSLNPNSFTVVQGQEKLRFSNVPANSQTTSTNTFTILVDRSVPFNPNFSDLQWTFQTTAAPPVANAGPNQTAQTGVKVTLNGSGSTNPSGTGTLTYAWAFTLKPTGSAANLANPASVMPTFTPDLAGNYTIMLTVSNGTDSSSASVTVSTVHSPPVANAGPNQTVKLNATVILNGSASSDVDGNPLTYKWTLTSVPAGSGAALTGSNTISPTFLVDKFGDYIAQLIVNDGVSDSLPSTVTISTSHTAPSAKAGSGQAVNVNTVVQLNGAASTDIDGNLLTYAWSLVSVPAGSKAALSNPAIANPTFTVDVPGTYVAQLIVSDAFMTSAPATVTVTTNAVLKPSAFAGPNQTVPHKTTVNLNGSGTDPQGLPLTFHWSLIAKPLGSAAVLSSTTVPTPTFFADAPGQYVGQLIVNNGFVDSDPSTVTITTTNTPPVANAGSNQSAPVGATITLNGSGSSDADQDSLTYTWSFLSRPNNSAAILNGANTASPTFTADQSGTYIVQLIVNDGFANSDPVTVTITAGAIVLTPNPLNLNTAQVGTLTVTIPFAAGPNGQVVNLVTNPSILAVPPSVMVPANATFTTTPVTPVGMGTATILAFAPGILPGTATANVVQATITVGSLTIGVSQTANATVTLSGPAPDNGLTITLVSSDPNSVTVPPSIIIPGGNTTGSFPVTGVALTPGAPVTITASATGYTSGTASVNVVNLGKIILPQTASVAPGQSVTYPITLATPAPSGGVTITLGSSDPNTATVTPSTVFIAGQTLTPAIQPKLNGIAFGTANISASAPSFIGDTKPVQVTVTLSFPPGSLTLFGNQTQNLVLSLSSPAPQGGLPITLTSSDPSIATVPPSVMFPANATSVNVLVSAGGTKNGSTTITASANVPGIGDATGTVTDVVLGQIILPPNASVGLGQSTVFAISLPAPAPQGGVTVNLSSSDSSTLTINPATVTIPANASVPAVQPQVTGVAVGSATISASTSGFGPSTAIVNVTATASFPPGTVSLPGGTTQNVTLTLSAPTPKPLTINLHSDNTSLATVPATVTFAAGASTVPVPITGVAGPGGPTVIHASAANVPDATVNVTVTTVPAVILPAGVTISPSQSVAFPVSLPTPAASDLTVNLSSGSPSTATISPASVAILSGATTPAVQPTVTGITFGPAIITATANGYAPGSQQVLVAGSLSFPPGPLSVSAGMPLTATLTLSAPAPAGFTANLTSSNPSAASVAGSVSFQAGATTADVPIVAGVAGATTITANANAPNVTPATLVLNVSAPGIINLPANVTVGPNQSAPFPLSLASPAPANGVTVTLSSANPAIATIQPGTVFIGGGLSTPAAQPTVNGVNFGTTTINVSAPGYTPTPASPTVTVGAALSFPPGTTNVSAGTTQNLALSLSGPAPASFVVSLNSSNPGVATVPGTVNFPANATSVPVPVTGVTTGSTTITASSSIPTVSGASAGVSVASGIILPANVIAQPGNTPIAFPVTLGSPAPTTVSIQLTSSDPSKVALSASGASTVSYLVQAGQTAPNTLVRVFGIDFGSATITATASGFDPVTQTVLVGATATFSPNVVSVDPGSSKRVTLNLSAASPTGVTVNLSSDNPSVAIVPASVFFGPNVGSVNVNINGVTQGSTLIHASALPFIPDAKASVLVGALTPPVITTTSLADAQVGIPYSQTLNGTGGIVPYSWSLISGTLPNGLSLDPSGLISGTPTTTVSNTPLTFQLTDFSFPTPQTTTAALTLTVSAPGAVAITSTSLPGGVVNAPYNATLTAIGGNKPYFWSLAQGSTLPNGLSLSPTGFITGTPTATVSNLPLTFKVTDSTTPTASVATKTLTLTIGSGDLTITTTSLADGTINKPYSQTLQASGGVGPYTWSIPPGGGRLPVNYVLNPTTGVISSDTGTSCVCGGVIRFTIQVTDSLGHSATQPFTININDGSLQLTTTSLPNGQVGVPYSAMLLAQDGTPPYTWSLSGILPSGLSFDTSSGKISGTPTASGTARLRFTVTDSAVPSGQTFVILNLTISSGPPTITTTSLPTGAVGTSYNAAVNAGGGAGPYTFSATGLPSGLSINAAGQISGTPATAGTTTATVTVTDSTSPTPQTATANLSITIVPPLTITPPTPATVPIGTLNSPYTGSVSATGGVPPYTFTATNLPAGLVISASGQITGTPTAAGTTTAVVTVTDSLSPTHLTATANVPITIVSSPIITTTTLTDGITNTFYTATVNAQGGTQPYTFSATGLPAGLSISTAGQITGTPTTVGTSTAAITVTDSTNPAHLSQTKNLSIKIVAPLSISTTSLPDGLLNNAYNASVSAQGGATPYTWSATGLPANLTINPTTGVIGGTATSAVTNQAVTITVTDATNPAQTASKNLTITIGLQLTITTPSPLPNGVVNTAYNTTISAQGGTGSLTWSATGLPANLTIDPSTGVISGTPTSAGGPTTATITVKDSAVPQHTTTKQFAITIVQPPTITTTSLPGVVVNTSYNAPALSAQGGTAPLTWSAANLPAGLNINPSTGVITGSPTTVGTTTATITVTDSSSPALTASKNLSIAVVAPLSITTNSLPVGNANVLYNTTLNATGGTGPYAWSATGLPAPLTMSAAGQLSGTPTGAFSGTVTITVTDPTSPAQTVSKNFQLTINAPLNITTTSLGTGTQNVPFGGQPLQATGGQPPYTWSATGLPTGLQMQPTGQITGTPTVAGTSTAAITVTDSNNPALSVTKNLPITIVQQLALNPAPATLPNGFQGQPYSFTAMAVGGVPPYTWSAVGLPNGLGIDSSTGVISGTPTALVVNQPVTITVTDSASPHASVSANPTITVGPPPQVVTISQISVGKGLQAPVTFSIPTAPPPGSGGQALTISVADPSLVQFNAGAQGLKSQLILTIPENQTSVVINAVGLALGQTTLTAAGGVYTGSAPIKVAPTGFTLSGPSGSTFTTTQGATTTLTVSAVPLDASGNAGPVQALAPGTTATVPLSSSNPGIGTVPASVLFNAGDSSRTATFTAVATGNATETIVTVMAGTPPGFSVPVANTVTAHVSGVGCSLPNVSVGRNLETTANVALTGQAPGGLQVVVTSADPSKVLLACLVGSPQCTGTSQNGAGASQITLNVAAGASRTPDFYVYGVGTPGTVNYMANCAFSSGAVSDTKSVTVNPAGFILAGPSGPGSPVSAGIGAATSAALTVSSVMLDSSLNPARDAQGNIITQPLAGGLSSNPIVNLTETDLQGSNVGSISPTSVTFISGSGVSTASALFTGSNPGQARLAVVQPSTPAGFSPPSQFASLTASVFASQLTVCDGVSIGFHLQAGCLVSLTQAVAAATTVTLTTNSSQLLLSADPTKAGSQSITVTIPAGKSLSNTFYLQALASSGTATYTGSASGFGSNTGTVTFTPSGVLLFGPNNSSSFSASVAAGPVPLNVYLYSLDPNGPFGLGGNQQLAGGFTLNLSIGTDASGIGTVAPTTINGGSSLAFPLYTPHAPGQNTISVATPVGFTTTGFQQINATVTP